MKKEDFHMKTLEILRKQDLEFPEEHFEELFKYMEMLIEWNERINLTSITEPGEIIEKHFVDSLTILPYIEDNQNVIDIGTGAGFPGIPVSIANKKIKVTLLDSLNKRINFLNEVISCLKLINVETVHSRAEDYVKITRETYDIAVSRAVANMSTLAEYLLPYVKVGGRAIFMKGPNVHDEIEKSKKAIRILGGKIEKIDNFLLNDNERNLIIIKKIKNTPKQYPRKAGKPNKEPIC